MVKWDKLCKHHGRLNWTHRRLEYRVRPQGGTSELTQEANMEPSESLTTFTCTFIPELFRIVNILVSPEPWKHELNLIKVTFREENILNKAPRMFPHFRPLRSPF